MLPEKWPDTVKMGKENGQSNELAYGNVKRYRANLCGGGASCRKGQASASQKSQKLLLGDFPEIAKTYTRGLRNVQELFSDKDVSARNLSGRMPRKGPPGLVADRVDVRGG